MSASRHLPPPAILALIDRCAWCRRLLTPQTTITIAGLKLPERTADIERLRGRAVYLELKKDVRRFPGLVPLKESTAAREGYDVLFLVCSPACERWLADGLRDEKQIVSIASAGVDLTPDLLAWVNDATAQSSSE